jgi:zinc and cadmium transporter
MIELIPIVGFTALAGIASALLAGVVLLLGAKVRERVMPHMVSFATGALLGTALLALVPHAIEGAGVERVHEIGIALLAGIGVFFVLEKFFLWQHCHTEDVESHAAHEHHRHGASAWIVLAGDGLRGALGLRAARHRDLALEECRRAPARRPHCGAAPPRGAAR